MTVTFVEITTDFLSSPFATEISSSPNSSMALTDSRYLKITLISFLSEILPASSFGTLPTYYSLNIDEILSAI